MQFTVHVLKACGNRQRLRLLRSVLEIRRPAQQNELVSLLGLPQHLAARYLQILVQAGLLRRERKGLPVRYRLPRGAPAATRRVLRLVRELPLEIFDIPAKALERLKKKRV